MATKNTTYLNNPNLKTIGVNLEYTHQQISEYRKCATDPIYFIKNYVKVVHVDRGTVPFALYSYQERIVNAYHDNRKVIVLAPRQMGKTVTTGAYFLWVVLFNADKNVAILANKAEIAREILSKVKYAYENLPIWLQQGVVKWNEGSIELENHSSIIASATSPNAIRGRACSHIYCDELAFVPKNIAEEFLTSVFPVISSGITTKIFISSTPRGMNLFHKMWNDANSGKNGFHSVAVTWDENPSRDSAWLEDQRKNLGEVKFSQEVQCAFLGSSATLISGAKLATLTYDEPAFTQDYIKIFEHPKKDHAYVITVDTSRGQHLDHSAFVIFDITQLPYKVVGLYKYNGISPMSYPFLIARVGEKYNNAHLLIEINDIGGQVADTLFYELEYDNMYFTYKDAITEGDSKGYPGIRSTKRVKSLGCSNLKDLVEGDQLELVAYDIIEELGVFVQKGASYAADDATINDDLTTCLWLFGYLVKQPIFSDLTNVNIRHILAKQTEQYISDNMIPFGLISTVDDKEIQFDIPVNHPDAWIFGDILKESDD